MSSAGSSGPPAPVPPPEDLSSSREPTAAELHSARDASPAVRAIEAGVAAHHVLVLDYVDEAGREEQLTVWPAFIRASSAGHVVLWAVSPQMGHWVQLRLDRVRGARATGESFEPSW